jgi:DNA-directed RNA polymerase subunit E'/Rpb7
LILKIIKILVRYIMSNISKQELKTTTIHIPSKDIYRTKDIDGLIKFNLKKQFENVCGKYGYVLEDSITVVKRSIGKIVTHNGISNIEYNITYKMNTILPCKGDVYEAVVDNITKMGIISYIKMESTKFNSIKESPLLIIVPQMYLDKELDSYSKGQKIKVEVLDKRVKYRAKQIQVVGKIV